MTINAKITPDRLKLLHTLLSKLEKMAYKIDFVVEATKGRESSSKELTPEEGESIIKMLQEEAREKGLNKPQPQNLAVQRMKGKILSICHEMKMHLPNSTKLDMHRVEALILKYGYLHKGFNEYKELELPTLVSQFDNILKSYYKKGIKV